MCKQVPLHNSKAMRFIFTGCVSDVKYIEGCVSDVKYIEGCICI